MRTISRVPAAVLVFLAVSGSPGRKGASVHAAEPEQKAETPTVRLEVTPADEPVPALKYRLLPEPVEMQQGNAATLYYKAMVFEGPNMLSPSQEQMRKIQDDYGLPLAQLPTKEAALGSQYDEMYADLRRAAYRDHCDWEFAFRTHGINTNLGAAQSSRGIARVLTLKAGLEIRDGHFDEAFETMRVGLALARNVGDGESGIQPLIGVAMTFVLFGRLEDFIGADSSPNLYWALTSLPRPLIGLRKAFAFEYHLVEFTIPKLAELDKRRFSPEEASELADAVFASLVEPQQRLNPLRRSLWAMQAYPSSMKFLLSEGRSRAELEQLPVLQVVLMAGWHECRIVYDNIVKWTFVERFGQVPKAHEEALRGMVASSEMLPYAGFVPILRVLPQAVLRNERQIESLRVVEALRLYAARHGHRWPEKLSDISEVPVPSDPQTGKEFSYHVENEAAVLELPPPPGLGPELGKKFILTIRH